MKSLKTMAPAAMAGLLAITSVVPAQAQNVTLSFGQQQQLVQTYCDRHPNDYDCRGYYDNSWGRNDYTRFYQRNRGDLDPLAAGIFGFAAGAIIAGAISNSNSGNGQVIRRSGSYEAHVDACYDRYRSYDEESDTFLGYDGRRHRCNL